MKKIAHILLGREKLITPTEKVLQPLPHKDFRFASPFILLHHGGPDTIPPGSENRIHPHPHRGFAPVSYILQGQFHHKDSTGNDQILNAGDVQWMFAGKGILHSEGPSEHIHHNGGTNEMVQLWINVPVSHKWDEPRYQYAAKEAMPPIFEEEGIDIRLVSGTLDNQTGPITISYTPITSAMGTIRAGKTIQIPVVSGYWTLVYIMYGSILIDDTTTIDKHNLIIFEKEGDVFSLTAHTDAIILFLSGEPIDEPVAAKDNFVMTTMAEVDQAIEDYKNGLFGTLDY
ncbi:pirin family protein [Xanthocytophaga agilis]|uniref:Pirin family protein n=1 Tax=Xanthocytophaga agilis TaxID=3048010 RepID=A0AAE3QW25_9BACT|nr:pirin family protein [Xanthocytophaga agilis]MDJ1499091.1 pirin family protein [Xanthocytophaga agilis]